MEIKTKSGNILVVEITPEEDLMFDNIEATKKYYKTSYSPIYKSINKNKTIKTIYGNKTFKKISVSEALSRFS